MAFDLTNTISRVRSLLMESGTAIWSDAIITEGIRLAVGEVGLQRGEVLTLSGLDGAAATTVPAVLESAVVVGGAAYAGAARAVDRAEQFELANESDSLVAWSDARMKDWLRMLREGLNVLRLQGLRSTSAPWGSWSDEFGEINDGDI